MFKLLLAAILMFAAVLATVGGFLTEVLCD